MLGSQGLEGVTSCTGRIGVTSCTVNKPQRLLFTIQDVTPFLQDVTPFHVLFLGKKLDLLEIGMYSSHTFKEKVLNRCKRRIL